MGSSPGPFGLPRKWGRPSGTSVAKIAKTARYNRPPQDAEKRLIDRSAQNLWLEIAKLSSTSRSWRRPNWAGVARARGILQRQTEKRCDPLLSNKPQFFYSDVFLPCLVAANSPSQFQQWCPTFQNYFDPIIAGPCAPPTGKLCYRKVCVQWHFYTKTHTFQTSIS